jgi:hypothetical protein
MLHKKGIWQNMDEEAAAWTMLLWKTSLDRSKADSPTRKVGIHRVLEAEVYRSSQLLQQSADVSRKGERACRLPFTGNKPFWSPGRLFPENMICLLGALQIPGRFLLFLPLLS